MQDCDGRLLVDFVGKFESLQNDFDQVCARLGIAETTLPHVNATKRTEMLRENPDHSQSENPRQKRPYVDYYDAALADYVGELYANDIETFGYRFGDGVNVSTPSLVPPQFHKT